MPHLTSPVEELESIQSIDEQSFELIFRNYYTPLVHFSMKYLDGQEEGEEVVQETFASIWAKLEQTEIRTTVKSYLYGAVRNACLNQIKHRKVVIKHVQHELYLNNEGVDVDFLEYSELEDQVKDAFDKLSPKCREVFELSRYDGMKYQEIANHLELSIKTVERHMGKALKILREELGSYLPILLWLIQNNKWG